MKPRSTRDALAQRDQNPQSAERPADVPVSGHSPERAQRATAIYRSYHRWLRASRLAMAAFLAFAVLFLAWTIPWLPRGFEAADYPPSVVFTIYLLISLTFMGIISFVFREWAWRKRESLMVWSTVYDETTGLHNRSYLLDRLSLECDRASRGNGVFSLIVLQIRIGAAGADKPPTLSNSVLQQVATLIDGLTHPTDLVALVNSNELAVLAIGVDKEHRDALLERLGAAVTEELQDLLPQPVAVSVAGGAATYPMDAKEPNEPMQAARTAAAFGSLPRRRVA